MDTTTQTPTPPQTPSAIASAIAAAANPNRIEVPVDVDTSELNALAKVLSMPVPGPKPGYRTTEFWLKVLAMLLSMLFASGALTNNTAIAIAGMAASMLGALGYTVSRTMLKNGAGLLLITLFAAPALISCSATARARETAGVAAAIDCEDANLKALVADALPIAESYLLSLLDPAGHKVDKTKLTADADKLTSTSEIMRCAIATALAVISTPAPANPSAPQAAPAQLDPADARAAWDAVRVRHGWGDTRTAAGVW